MARLRQLIHEIHRRSLWQVMGIYVAGSWLALQVVDLLVDNFALPGWLPPLALALLVIGFPVVLATAFVRGLLGGGVLSVADRRAMSADVVAPHPDARDLGGLRVATRTAVPRVALLLPLAAACGSPSEPPPPPPPPGVDLSSAAARMRQVVQGTVLENRARTAMRDGMGYQISRALVPDAFPDGRAAGALNEHCVWDVALDYWSCAPISVERSAGFVRFEL